ncbi:uncharacterized protein [Oscarella lobularis]|uniref:uncharacterized protein n=1 Tax=Oscarella lobularis TaxID=121494 RepID=UPI003313BB99
MDYVDKEDKEDYVEDEGWCEHYSILDVFSPEVHFLVLSHLDWHDLCTMSQTCRYFRELCTNRVVWSTVRRLDFTNRVDATVERILETASKCPRALALRVDTSFSDEQFLQLLRRCPHLRAFDFKNAEAMTNASLVAIASKCLGVSSVKLRNSAQIDADGIRDLLEHQPDLDELKLNSCANLAYVELKHPDPNRLLILTRVTLKRMVVDENQIQILCANCPQLEYLNLSESSLQHFTMVEVADGLSCLTHLNLSQCYSLHIVDLTDLTELKEINVSYCSLLARVSVLSCNALTSFHVTGSASLKTIDIESDELTSLDLSSLRHLTSFQLISCSHLQQLNLSMSHKISIDVIATHLFSLKELVDVNVFGCSQLDQNALESIIATAPWLRALRLGNVSLHALNFSGVIQSLFLDDVRELSWINFKSSLPLRHLSIKNCISIEEEPLLEGILYGKRLKKTLNFSPPPPASLPIDINQNLATIHLTQVPNIIGSGLSQLGIHLTSLRELFLDRCYFLKTLSVDSWPRLETISIQSCSRLSTFLANNSPHLTNIKLDYCGFLNDATIQGGQILNDVSTKGTSFRNFSLASTRVTELHLDGVMTTTTSSFHLDCPNLIQIAFWKCNEITDAQVNSTLMTSCPRLRSLTIDGATRLKKISLTLSITSLILNGLRRLEEINIDPGTRLESVSLSGLPRLSTSNRDAVLTSSASHLKNIKMTGFAKMTSIRLDFSFVESIQVDQCIRLREMRVACPQLAHVTLQGVPNLTSLYLEVNRLEQLQVQSRSCTIPSLRHLHLVCHKARFLARILAQYCPHLQTLVLTQALVTLSRLKSVANTLKRLEQIELNHCLLEVTSTDSNELIIQRKNDSQSAVRVILNETKTVQHSE